MERDSFIFYKSFYEAIEDLPRDIRLEVLTAIIEYALFGRLPENLKPFARGMFTLIRPIIDANTTRFENGKKGGRKPRASKQEPPAEPYSLTYEQEIEQMRADAVLRKTLCKEYGISPEEYDSRLSRFLIRCNDDKQRKGKSGHDSLEDCHSHLRFWMTKAFRKQDEAPSSAGHVQPSAPSDYSFKGGFGGQDV